MSLFNHSSSGLTRLGDSTTDTKFFVNVDFSNCSRGTITFLKLSLHCILYPCMCICTYVYFSVGTYQQKYTSNTNNHRISITRPTTKNQIAKTEQLSKIVTTSERLVNLGFHTTQCYCTVFFTAFCCHCHSASHSEKYTLALR